MAASNLPQGHPTVLVAENDPERRDALVSSLRQDDYLVLEAHDRPGILDIVTTHSRPIHLLLLNTGINSCALGDRLKKLRPRMHILFVGQFDGQARSQALTPEIALASIRAFFRNPKATPQGRERTRGGTPATQQSELVPSVRPMKAAG
jgi:CheY-like chemotaxis protein